MNFLTLRLCGRLRYRVYDSMTVNNVVKRCSHVSGNEEHVSATVPIKSKLFPDYNVVYHLPQITFIYVLNRLKRNCTVVSGGCVPAALIMSLLDFMPLNDCLTMIAGCFVVTLPLHIAGYLCNDVIGSICVKDKEKVVISYIDYWGTRVDLKTDIENVEPLTEVTVNSPKFLQLFRYLKIKSPKKKLRLYIDNGKIHDKSGFCNVVGDW